MTTTGLFGDHGSGAWRNLDPLATNGAQPGNDTLKAGAGSDWIEGNQGDDLIDCGTESSGRPSFLLLPDSSRDTVNFHAGDGSDVVTNFGAGAFVIGPPTGPGLPPQQFDPVNDVLRIENVGNLILEVVNGGTLVENSAGSVFLVGVTTPLTHVVSGNYLLVFDAT